MQPAAVLSVLVTTEGVGPSNAKLNSVQSTLRKTQAVADTAGTSVASAGKRIEKAGAGMSRFGKSATKYYATPLLAAAGASVYFAQKYEKSMLMVQTHTDTNRRDLALYKREILDMGRSGKYTQGPNELAEAMYHIASDGFKGKKATDMLRKSADLAMVGQSGMASTTYALVSAMKTQIRGTESAGDAINTLNAIVGAGDMKMEDLVGAMSTGILPAAKAMGLSLKDVGVAEDIMTQRGVPAQQAAYRLAMTFQMLIPHTEKAEDAFESLGLKNKSLIATMEKHPREGLLSALELLHRKLDDTLGPKGTDQIQTIEEIFGGGRTSRGAITLLQNLDSVRDTYGRINQLAGETPKKIQQAKAAPVNKLRESWVQVQTVLIEVGSDIIPMVAAAITDLAGWIQHIAAFFHSLPPGIQMGIIKFLALTVALSFLIRIMGFFVKSFGIMLGWFAKGESETALLIASQEALAAAYGETAAAATTSAAVQTAAIEEVAVAQKIAQAAAVGGMPIGWMPGQQSMTQIMPAAEEAGQMSMFGTVPRAAAAAAPEAEAAAATVGGGMAASLAGGLASMLPPALAAIGLGNILISVLGGDTEGAAYKGGGAVGGAIIGGILGSVIPGAGTVAGALAGAGLGSILGGVAEGIFGSGGKEMTDYQKRVKEASEKVASQLKRQKAASHAFNKVSDQIGDSQKRHQVTSKHLEKAEEAATRATHKYGASSRQAARATERLNRVKSEAVQANRRLANAEKLQGAVKTAVMRADKTAIANIREKKQALAEEYQQLFKRLRIVQKQPPSDERDKRERNKLREINKTKRALEEQKSAEEKIFSSARTQIGDKFVKSLEKINPHMYNLKKAAHAAGEGVKEYQHTLNQKFGVTGLADVIDTFKKAKVRAKDTGTQINGPFKTQSKSGFSSAATSAKNFDTAASGALGHVGEGMNKMLTTMGASPLKFGSATEKAGKAQKKMRGGQITNGAPEGDSVHAVLEKGEYVMNREAVKKVGVHQLNAMNFGMAPRMGLRKMGKQGYQEGGEVGNIAAALAKANNIDQAHYPYLWGGGHGGFTGPYDCSGAVSAVLHAAGLLGKPMVSGELADYGAPGPGPITVYANDVHTFMKIAGRFFGTSGANPGGGAGWFSGADTGGYAVRHPTGVMLEKLAHTIFKGPEGDLRKIGQGAIDHVEAAGNKYISAHMPGGFGGGDMASFGPGRIVGASTYHPDAATGTVGAAGESLIGKMAFAELDMGHSLGGLPFHSKLGISRAGRGVVGEKLDIGLGGGDVDGHHRAIDLWYQTANAMGLPSDWLGLVKIADPNQKKQDGGLIGGPEAFLKAGGKAEKGKGSLEKSIKSTIGGIAEGKHLPKFNSHLKKIGRRISKIDLPESQMKRLGSLTNDVEKWGEYAGNASAMTLSDEDGNVVQGIFKGGTEASWLEKELTGLINLRKQVVGSHEVIATKTLPRIMKLLKHTQERLHKAQKAIREDEAKKRELEKHIRDLEKAQNDNVQKLEKEKKELETKLNSLQGAKNPNQAAIGQVRNEIKSKNEAINSSNAEATKAIKKDHQKIHDLDEDVHDKKRVEAAAKTLIGNLTDRRSSLYTTMTDLFTGGGEFEGKGLSFYGLEQIQGKGGTTGDIPNPPEFGSVGGEIFDVQSRLRQIQEELSHHNPTEAADTSELQELEKEIALEWKKKYLVSQAQFATLSGFPSVAQTQAVPSAGNYATGGLVAATVGERGREVAVMPTGSRVVPEHDAKEAISKMGGGDGTPLIIEQIVIEEDGTTKVTIGGKEFEAAVKNVTRKQSRSAGSPTPGGRSR